MYILFLFPGDKASRRIRMLNDIYLWKRDSPYFTSSYEASLVIFADQFKCSPYYTKMLKTLNDLRYGLLLVTPTLDIYNPESPEWPALLIDRGAVCFPDQAYINIPEEPSPKTHQADDAAAAEEERNS